MINAKIYYCSAFIFILLSGCVKSQYVLKDDFNGLKWDTPRGEVLGKEEGKPIVLDKDELFIIEDDYLKTVAFYAYIFLNDKLVGGGIYGMHMGYYNRLQKALSDKYGKFKSIKRSKFKYHKQWENKKTIIWLALLSHDNIGVVYMSKKTDRAFFTQALQKF